MNIKIFSVAAIEGESQTEELNKFLSSEKVTGLEKQFIKTPNGPIWSFCITYIPSTTSYTSEGKSKSVDDYMKMLNDEATKHTLALLVQCRKVVADKHDVKAFNVFTNMELFKMVGAKAYTIEEIKKIPVNLKSREKYAEEVLKMFNELSRSAATEKKKSEDLPF